MATTTAPTTTFGATESNVSVNSAVRRTRIKARYGNFIGETFAPPVRGQYFTNVTPITGGALCEVPRSTAEDVDKALDAAHSAAPAWGRASATERARALNKI